MIYVDVEVPILGKIYDFQIDEEALFSEIVKEIHVMICQQEQFMSCGDHKRLMLWNAENGQRLLLGNTAIESKIRSGSHLLLV